jgi:hypothetical protein
VTEARRASEVRRGLGGATDRRLYTLDRPQSGRVVRNAASRWCGRWMMWTMAGNVMRVKEWELAL